MPSMAIGASFGRMVGILVQALQEAFPKSQFFASCEPDVPCITPGTYAFLGAGAALSGIMHLTITVTVIMFELTGALTYILPTMVSFVFAHIVLALLIYLDRGGRYKGYSGSFWKRRNRRPDDLVQRIPVSG